MKNNYYETLGISSTATQEEIKNAYRTYAKKYHPDINNSSEAENIMKSVNQAYDTLSDLEARKKYDIILIIISNLTEASSSAYSSYTKTRNESEAEYEDFIIDYLNKERKKCHTTKELDSEIIRLRNLKERLENNKNSVELKNFAKYYQIQTDTTEQTERNKWFLCGSLGLIYAGLCASKKSSADIQQLLTITMIIPGITLTAINVKKIVSNTIKKIKLEKSNGDVIERLLYPNLRIDKVKIKK